MLDKYSVPQKQYATSGGRFHVMAKPSGSTCNLDCKYCFYLSKETLPKGPGTGEMSDDTLELFIRQYIEDVTSPQVVFSWQGGEPTLRGLDFYRRVVALQKKYAKPNQRIENDLQTNGVLLNEEWGAFLKKYRFLVGLSIDGPRELHDRFRVNKGGAPTFDKVMAAAKLLRKFGVSFNTLTCVHRANASRPLDVYRFLRSELDSTYIQFIPIVQLKGFETTAPQTWDESRLPIVGSPEARPGHPNSVVTDWSVDPEEYGYFLSRVFDEWRRKDFGKVLVNHFETLVAQHMGLPSQICIYGEICGKGVGRARWQRLFLRPLRLPGVSIGDNTRKAVGGNGFRSRASQVRLRKVRNIAALLSGVYLSQGLLGRMSEEPPHPHAGRRAGSQLSLRRT